MLGELIGEDIGKITAQRVLPSQDGMPCMEISFETDGTMLGRHSHDIGTYTAVMQPDGTLRGEGRGIVTTEDGDVLTWSGGGVGTMAADGSVAYRGAIYFRTAAERFARLNTCACVFEYDVDASGKAESKTWEWK